MSDDTGGQLPIETARLLLRRYEPSDLDALAEMHGDDDLVRWVPWGPRTRAEAEQALDRKIACVTIDDEGDGLGLAGILKDGGELIADFSLQRLSVEHSVAELGYMLRRDRHGHGYAIEGCEAIVELALTELGFHRVVARIEERNAPSIALAERLGMRREAHFIENEWVKGEWQSEVVYAILADEWVGRKS